MTTALAAGTYRLDTARTKVRFTVKAIFGLATVRGTFDVREGSVAVPGARVRAELDAASFTTDNPRRDRDIRSARFLATSEYPLMSFVGTEVSPVAGGWTLRGDLTVRDVTSPVTLTVTAVDELNYRATTRLDRYRCGLRMARGMVGRWLDVTLEVRLTRTPVA